MAPKRSMQITLLLCSFVIPAVGSAQVKYDGGTGDPNDPYLIYTAEQMNAIGACRDDWDKHLRLMADIDLSAYTGTESNILGVSWEQPFVGIFDGGGYTISNSTWSSSGRDYLGLFGCVGDETAQIKGLSLICPRIEVDPDEAVGALVGDLSGGSITNCYVQDASVSANCYAGGLIGYVYSGKLA
ncbi:MAG: hypothetical protein JSW27_15460 [Phycisphaerales bacterium]|nr:MAG: hypothetical protein JSW27_15460 [Phycisphaerales bacterium]